jgi:predicted HicB family RNase H-like nuclease
MEDIKDKPFLLRMPPDLHKELKLYCVEKGISMQDFIMKAVSEKADKRVYTPEREAV